MARVLAPGLAVIAYRHIRDFAFISCRTLLPISPKEQMMVHEHCTWGQSWIQIQAHN